jgi:hypothetical protein
MKSIITRSDQHVDCRRPSAESKANGARHSVHALERTAKLDRESHGLRDEFRVNQIFRITDKAEAQVIRAQPIKLLEVNANTAASGVMPLHFGPAPASGIPFSSIIIEVTPNEFQKIQSYELNPPEGWEVGEELPRPTVNGEGV